jgi:hypothetical protein
MDIRLTAFDCTSTVVANNPGSPLLNNHIQLFSNYLTNLVGQFKQRFPDLDTDEYRVTRFPFRANAAKFKTKQAEQLIELQSREALKVKFDTESLSQFWLTLPQEFGELKMAAIRHLVQFGSSYVCESAFSTMTAVKTDCRSQLTNAHLETLLRVATTEYNPDYNAIFRAMSRQK